MVKLFSNFGIYDQVGELCVGGLKGYEELARELDNKQVAYCLKSEKEEVILGSRLIVEIIGGREDRLMFFAKFPADEIKSDTIINFYKTAKEEIEAAEFESGRYPHKKFKVLGSWKKGDIEKISNQGIPERLIKRIVGKLILAEKVSVASPDLFYNISLLAKVVHELGSDLKLGFKFAVSVFPVDADFSIKPEYKNADVDTKSGIRIEEGYEKVYYIYKRRAKGYFKSKAEMKRYIEEIYEGIKQPRSKKDEKKRSHREVKEYYGGEPEKEEGGGEIEDEGLEKKKIKELTKEKLKSRHKWFETSDLTKIVGIGIGVICGIFLILRVHIIFGLILLLVLGVVGYRIFGTEKISEEKAIELQERLLDSLEEIKKRCLPQTQKLEINW